MDVEPLDHYHGARRRMRRPVAGGLPYDPRLESLLEPLEDQATMPTWWWALVGFSAGAVAVAAAGISALLIAWHRLWNNT